MIIFQSQKYLFRSYLCYDERILRRNHYKNIWRRRVEFVEKVMLIVQLSHVLQGDVVQVFFVFLLNTDGLVAEFSVLEHLCRTYLILNFKNTSHISWKWKINWGLIGFLYCFYIYMAVTLCMSFVPIIVIRNSKISSGRYLDWVLKI